MSIRLALITLLLATSSCVAGANDDDAFAIKSSDVGQPFTSPGGAEADTYFRIQKVEATSGGASLYGFKDADGIAGYALSLVGFLGETPVDTTKSASALAPVMIRGTKTDGNSFSTPLGADENVLVVGRAVTGAAAVWLVDADGDTWQSGGADFNGTVDLNANSLENIGNENTDITSTAATFAVPVNSTYTADDYWTLEKSDSGPWTSQVFSTHYHADNTATPFIDVSVPNSATSTRSTYASIVIEYMVSTERSNGGGNKVYAGRAVSVVERGGDAGTATSTVTKLDSEVVAGPGAETIDISFDYSPISGSSTETQTFSIRITADSNQDQAGYIVYDAKIITYNTQHDQEGLKVGISPSP